MNHPEHVELTLGERVGRSRVCTKLDGTTVTVSSKTLNKLSGKTPVLKTTRPTLENRSAVLNHVRDIISGWESNEKLMLARELMMLAESYLI